MRDGALQGRRLLAVFDTEAGDEGERALLPIWGSLAVFYPNPLPNGFPSPATAARLEALEAQLRARLCTLGRSRLVGIITIDGRRELVIYTAAVDDLRAVAGALQADFQDLELQLTCMEDRDWTVFRQFVPARP